MSTHKKIIIVLFISVLMAPSFVSAASVGGPELSIPEISLFLKDKAVKKTLDRYDYAFNLKVGMDAEIVAKREFSSSPDDVTGAEMEGHNIMLKFSDNFKDIVEPYIKIGTSNLQMDWTQHGNDIRVESGTGFVYGVGAKVKLYDIKDWGVKLTLDTQYRRSDLDIDKAKIGDSDSVAAAINENFIIKEWQITLLGSKKLIIPMGENDYYIVPYGGLTYSMIEANIYFTQSTTGLLYSTYNAGDKNNIGLVLGFDIMPFYLSHYLLNFEMRLMNETAFTLGGTIKF